MSVARETAYTLPGIHVTDRELEVPLVWDAPPPPRRRPPAERARGAPVRRHDDRPRRVCLPGGPGGKGPRPTGPDGWVCTALATHRVVLLAPRGPARPAAVRGAGPAARGSGAAQAEYLSRFRADAIVADAEHVRRTVYGGRRWTSLGQSYGGFLTMTYLSRAPEALAACYVTGGLPGLTADAREVYRRTQPRVVAKNAAYRERYPDDAARLARVADLLAADDVRLPDGDRLTVRRLQSIGTDLGMKPGPERIHWLVDEAFDADAPDTLTDTFLAEVAAATSFRTNPLYAVLRESLSAQSGPGPSAWAAEAGRAAGRRRGGAARPLLLTGEMIYPWMLEEITALRPFRAAADALAAREEWPDLYDLDVLARNEVPVEAAVYFDDMFVDAGLSLDTAARVGNVRTWVTNEFEHDGLRTGDVLARLVERLGARGGPRT